MEYTDVQQALDFATASSAESITLKLDDGTYAVPLADALEGWDQLLPGSVYEVLGIHWNDPENA